MIKTNISGHRLMILILGQKGGVGKSALAELVISIIRASGHIIAAFDADSAVSSLYQKLAFRDANGIVVAEQNAIEGVVRYNARDEQEASLLINWLETSTPRAVHDLPGGSRDEIAKLLGAGADGSLGELLDFLDEMGCSLVLLHPVTGDAANINSQLNTLNAFGDRARHVAVINRAFQNTESDILPWRTSKTRKRLLEQGGREIELPALSPEIFQKLKAGHHPLWSDGIAANLTLLDRQRLKIFQRHFEREFSKIEEWLI